MVSAPDVSNTKDVASRKHWSRRDGGCCGRDWEHSDKDWGLERMPDKQKV